MRFFVAQLALIVLAACGPAPQRPQAVPLPTPSAPVREAHIIAAFGDSLTAGYGLPAEESYPAQLERRLRDAGADARVVNAGVSGDTAAQALDRLEWTLREEPTLAIVVLGANDGLRGLDLTQLEANLLEVVRRFQAEGATVLLGGMQIPPNYGPDYSRDFAAVYPRVAAATGAELLPFFLEGVAAERELNLQDGIHPTAGGYKRIVDDVLWPSLAPHLGFPLEGA